jgi:phosphotransferase system  glucose/maltose/N-acetylglucosamine-specific IIC component
MGHFFPLGIAQLVQFVLVALFAVGLVIGLTRRAQGRTWLPPLILVVILIPFALADVWVNSGLGNPKIRGVEGMDNDYLGVSLHYIVLIIAAVISLVCVGLAVRNRQRAAKAHAA